MIESGSISSLSTNRRRNAISQNWRMQPWNRAPRRGGIPPLMSERAQNAFNDVKNYMKNPKLHGRYNGNRSWNVQGQNRDNRSYHPYQQRRAFDLRDQLPPRQPSQMPHYALPQNQLVVPSDFAEKFQKSLETYKLLGTFKSMVNIGFAPKYDMEIQKEIATLQKRPLIFKCNNLVPVSRPGPGLDEEIKAVSTSKITLNQRFA